MPLHVFGIRHHGPGSARSVRSALDALAPDVVLVEGPPEAEPLLPLAGDPAMVPPVALLLYAPAEPSLASFYPFATFSPEWQAIRYGLERGVPVRFMDLPAAYKLALVQRARQVEAEPPADPLSWLASAEGYEDGERWWEHLVEERQDGAGVFAAILEAMTELRRAWQEAAAQGDAAPAAAAEEAWREAWMRRTIRQAAAEGRERIAAVCGAWHAPALAATLPPDAGGAATARAARADEALLRGLREVARIKVEATWIPWTYGNLAAASGYGAGVVSPGWYDHLWHHAREGGGAAAARQLAIHWLARVAGLLRRRDLGASSAQVIDAVRLAEALAALRGRQLPGLDELNEATLAVLLGGEAAPLQLIHRELIVSERLGSVAPAAPATPLERDLAEQQKALRLKPSATPRDHDLDLRQPLDLARSRLLHRLRMLDVPWGEVRAPAIRGKGTFRESWRLCWQPAMALAVVEAGRRGNTVESAAAALTTARAAGAATLADLCGWLGEVLLAGLPAAIAPLLERLEQEAAVASDVLQLSAALPDLVESARYGEVRQADTASLRHIAEELLQRIAVGLPQACVGLEDEAAAALLAHLDAVERAATALASPAAMEAWRGALARVADLAGAHGLLAGRCCRLLFDARRLAADELERRFGLAVSPGVAAPEAAAWIDGCLRGSALLLLHDRTLWALLDRWLCGLARDAFVQILPLLRRTFAAFAAPERRRLGELVTQGPQAPGAGLGAGTAASGGGGEPIDAVRAARVLPVLARLLAADGEATR